MWSTLVILHGDEIGHTKYEIDHFISWHTCMRSLYISDERLLDSDFYTSKYPDLKVYKGFAAYSFLLEIVCGLHSKLFGESEVQSQFKERFSESALSGSFLSEFLMKLRNHILEHSKVIRSKFLIGLGRQSYGGLCEKHIHYDKKVHLFGTGNLAEALLPHLQDGPRDIQVYGRNEIRLKALRNEFSIRTSSWDNYQPDTGAVILASTFFPEEMMVKFEKASRVLDFRENYISTNGIKNKNYIPFSELLSSIQTTNDSILNLKPQIYFMINQLTHSREEEQIHIMNGWEDLPQVCY